MPLDYTYSDFDAKLIESVDGNAKIHYDADTVFASLRNIMATVRGERVRNPIGSTLVGFLFEPVSEDVAADIISEIRRIIRLYEPRISNLRITASPNPDEMQYTIALNFQIIGINGNQRMKLPLRAFDSGLL